MSHADDHKLAPPSSNPYADPVLDHSMPVQNVIRAEGDSIWCRQHFDIRRFCFITGDELAAFHPGLPLRGPAIPGWWMKHHRAKLITITLIVILVAGCVGMRVAAVFFALRLLEIPLFVYWSLRRKATLYGTYALAVNPYWPIGWRQLNGVAFLTLIGVTMYVNVLLVAGFMRVGAPPPAFRFFEWPTVGYILLTLCGAVGELFVPMMHVRKEDDETYCIKGLPKRLVESIRNELAAASSNTNPEAVG